MPEYMDINIINIDFVLPVTVNKEIHYLFRHYDHLMETLPQWLEPFYEMRKDPIYNDLFLKNKNLKNKEIKAELKALIEKYHLSREDFKKMTSEKMGKYDYYLSRHFDNMYTRIEAAFIADKGLGFCLEELNKNPHMLEFMPIDMESKPILDVSSSTIKFMNETVKIPILTSKRLEYLKGRAICKAIMLKRNQHIILNIGVDSTVELSRNYPVYKKQKISKAAFERYLL